MNNTILFLLSDSVSTRSKPSVIYGEIQTILREQNINCHTIVKENTDSKIFLDKFFNSIHQWSESYDQILLISHIQFSGWRKELPNNIHHYGNIALPKSKQYKLFEKHNISVAPWIFNPQSLEEVFDQLGDKVVAKPNIGGFSKGVVIITPENNQILEDFNNYVFCKYVGETNPPFWKARIHRMFGNPIGCRTQTKLENEIIGIHGDERFESGAPDDDYLEWNVNPDVYQLAERADTVLNHEFPCALTGTDITGNLTGNYVLEINSNANSMPPRYWQSMSKGSIPLIANAIKNKFLELEIYTLNTLEEKRRFFLDNMQRYGIMPA